jgi:hypothetical protein
MRSRPASFPLFLLPGDRTTGAFSGPRVRFRPLAVHRETTAVTESAVASDVEKTLDVHGRLAAEHPFDSISFFDDETDFVDLIFCEILHTGRFRYTGLGADFLRQRMPDSVNPGQRNLSPLVPWQIDSSNTRHELFLPYGIPRIVRAGFLSLSLLVPWIGANDAQHALAFDELALVAALLDGCFHLHRFCPLVSMMNLSNPHPDEHTARSNSLPAASVAANGENTTLSVRFTCDGR